MCGHVSTAAEWKCLILNSNGFVNARSIDLQCFLYLILLLRQGKADTVDQFSSASGFAREASGQPVATPTAALNANPSPLGSIRISDVNSIPLGSAWTSDALRSRAADAASLGPMPPSEPPPPWLNKANTSPPARKPEAKAMPVQPQKPKTEAVHLPKSPEMPRSGRESRFGPQPPRPFPPVPVPPPPRPTKTSAPLVIEEAPLGRSPESEAPGRGHGESHPLGLINESAAWT